MEETDSNMINIMLKASAEYLKEIEAKLFEVCIVDIDDKTTPSEKFSDEEELKIFKNLIKSDRFNSVQIYDSSVVEWSIEQFEKGEFDISTTKNIFIQINSDFIDLVCHPENKELSEIEIKRVVQFEKGYKALKQFLISEHSELDLALASSLFLEYMMIVLQTLQNQEKKWILDQEFLQAVKNDFEMVEKMKPSKGQLLDPHISFVILNMEINSLLSTKDNEEVSVELPIWYELVERMGMSFTLQGWLAAQITSIESYATTKLDE